MTAMPRHSSGLDNVIVLLLIAIAAAVYLLWIPLALFLEVH